MSLLNKFSKKDSSPDVIIEFGEIRKVFGINDERYEDTPNMYDVVMNSVQRDFCPAHSKSKDLVRSFHVITDAATRKAAKADEEGGIFKDATDYVPGIIYAGRPKKTFAVIIRDGLKDGENKLLFGLHGKFNKEGNLIVQNLLIPQQNKDMTISKARLASVTDASVNTGIHFANLCIDQITSGEVLDVRNNLRKTEETVTQDIHTVIATPKLQ